MSVDSFFSRLNPLVCWILRSPLHWIASPGLAILSLEGRRSGRRLSFPVGYQRDGDGDAVTVMVSEARGKQWWRNLREPAPVELLLRGALRSGTGRLVEPGSADFAGAAEATLRRVPGMGRVFGISFDRRAGLTPEQLAHLADEIAIVRIDLDQD